MFNYSLKSLCLASLLSLVPFSAEASKCQSLQSINWILGEWLAYHQPLTTREKWQKVSNETFEGFAKVRHLDKEGIQSSETTRIVVMEQQVFYLAKVKENALPIAFKLVECTESIAHFENPDHDFPKSIVYQLQSSREMDVHVSDGEKGFSLSFKKMED